MTDDIGAFVPGPRVRIEGRAGGPLAGLSFAAKDLFDVAGVVDGRRQSRLADRTADPRAPFVRGADAARCRRHPDRQDHHRRGLARHPGRERLRRDAEEHAARRAACPAARPRARPPPSPPGSATPRSAPTPAARCGCRRASAACTGSGRRTDGSTRAACCPRRRPPTRPAGLRAMPRPSPGSRRSCWARRFRTPCRRNW